MQTSLVFFLPSFCFHPFFWYLHPPPTPPQVQPAAALVQPAEPDPTHQSGGGQPVSVPVCAAAETGSAQTHGPDGQTVPVQQAGLELVRTGWRGQGRGGVSSH